MTGSSAIVTARVNETKKLKVDTILKRRGSTPTSYINELYDRIIENDGEVWENSAREAKTISQEELREATLWAQSLPQIELKGEFKDMTTKQAKDRRLRGV